MQYDPIKSDLGRFFNRTPRLRILFYRLLNLLLLRTWHVKKELRIWESQHRETAKILDAGMGFGQYSYLLAQHHPNWEILGVDIKDDQVDDCNTFFRKAGLKNARFEVADLERFSSPPLFDLILSIDVMEHIPNDEAVFQNFFHALKPGGMLLISTPSDQGGSDVHPHDEDISENASHSFIGEHVRDGYNILMIQKKLREAGFSCTEAYYTYGKPGKISWNLSMKYPIVMLNLSKLFFILLPFYYLIAFPFALLLNQMDISRKHSSGTGLIVKAWK
ncbi:MAG TPA: class I SAM-dependent methyltransferase [Bacteroidales bacterium]|jgi:SAM-dependent methyltransferase|nr:MAG: Ubiquinone biosynthesis O-methyltransferase [Bacteroidetes bacterium ADurb.Bin012]HNQ59578.1 class I SAM-dependent methyltransferase [Bacteroidales bacterium]HNU21178.1 class I SAM-dependent methyltransferase [Bacteroidales bacterium]HNV16734.1 class I SAM-dependent methyltransferase [Bacteroidales bacterium]HNZ79448.1 class I SAM-dependent methyltransferase [Bacteroidales bacterium]